MPYVSKNDGGASSQLSPPAAAVAEAGAGQPPRLRRWNRRPSETGAGMAYGLAAYGLWGMLPLYFTALIPAGPLEIVANRIVWSLLFCLLLITALRGWRKFRAAMSSWPTFGSLSLAAALIAVNWFTYTIAVLNGHTIEASLGYFINPLVSVLLGVILLKERLRPAQWVAMGVALAAVLVLAFGYGNVPWISLILAFSFGFYGLVKKNVGGRVDAVTSLSVETLVLTPVSVVIMVLLISGGQATLLSEGTSHFWLMAASGVITAMPLLFFGAAASRLPLSSIGMLQYLAPILQFITALVILHEPMPLERWIGFSMVWLSLIILTTDMVVALKRAPKPGVEPAAAPGR